MKIINKSDGGFFFWLWKYFVFGLGALLLLLTHAGTAVYAHFASQLPALPNLDEMAQHWPARSVIYANDGQILAEFAREWREPVPLSAIPPHLTQAFLAAEDRRFFEHGGIDLRGIARALVKNFKSLAVRQGGSTISQQVAKTLLGSERTLERKIREAILARRLERRLGKQGVLYLYANLIFLGNRAYGVQAAARRYFHKDVSALSLSECALIAGLARAPSRYSPLADPVKAKERRDQVLGRMEREHFITAQERDRARDEPLKVTPRPEFFRERAPDYAEQVRREVLERYGEPALTAGGLHIYAAVDLGQSQAAHAALDRGLRQLDKRQGWRGPEARLRSAEAREAFLRRARRRYGEQTPLVRGRMYLGLVDKVTPQGAEVTIGGFQQYLPLRELAWAARYTTRDSTNDRVISDARKVVEVGDVIWVRALSGPEPSKGREQVTLEQTPRVEGVVYGLNLKTGYVEALIGGRDFDESEFNRATQACRQPGSAFKPIYYSLALDRGLTLATPLKDSPTKETNAEGEVWAPQNLHGQVFGTTTLWHALVMSLNLASIDLLTKIGFKETVDWAHRLGIRTTLHPDLGLALGASCVKPAELVQAFAVFAEGGKRPRNVTIRRIVDRTGRVLEDSSAAEDPFLTADERLDRMAYLAASPPEQIIDSTTAYLISRALRDSASRGIAWAASKAGAPAAGKTGTSSRTMDTWFVGFTESLLAGVWVGSEYYDRPIGLKDTGSSVALPIWVDYVKPALGGRAQAEIPLEKPKGLVSARVDENTGLPVQATAKGVVLPFREGTVPAVPEPSPEGAVQPPAPAEPMDRADRP